MTFDYRQIIRTHVTTERSTKLREKNNEYVFEVDRKANKYQVRMAVEEAFKVKVDSVRTITLPGKRRRMGRSQGKTSARKKAVVRLKQGESITIFENV